MKNVDEEYPQVNVGRSHSPSAPNDRVQANNVNMRPNLEEEPRQDSILVIPNAIPVDNDVAIATPLEPQLPWWKQEKARLTLAVFCIVLIALSIALGIALSSANATATEVVTNMITLPQSPSPSGTPSFSTSPSAKLTDVPSSSSAPSFSPTICTEKMTTNAQRIDLQLVNLSNPKVAVDERIMVVITRDSGSSLVIYGMFYTLQNDGWERVLFFLLIVRVQNIQLPFLVKLL